MNWIDLSVPLFIERHHVSSTLVYDYVLAKFRLPISLYWGAPAVDGDPHFMIELPDREDALCFNINDKPGTIFNLVRDQTSGELWVLIVSMTFLLLDKYRMQLVVSFKSLS